jgi:hypothetical protein
MDLVFNLTLNDCVAFSDYHFARARSHRRARRFLMFGFAAIWVGFGLLIWMTSGRFSGGTPYFVLAAVWIGFMPRVMRWVQRRATVRAYTDGSNRSLLGRHQVHIGEDGLTWTSEHSESKSKWSAFERLASTPDHTFLYLSAVMALVIPRLGVVEGDYETFVRTLAQKVSTVVHPASI